MLLALSAGKDERVEGTMSFTFTNDWLKKMYFHMWILCDRNWLVFASWRFRLTREYDGVVDANILKIVRRLLLWWHVHNSFLVYVAFLFYLSTLDDCLEKSRDHCLTKFNQPITENCDVSVTYFVRHMIGSFNWLCLVNQTARLVSRNSNPYHSKTAPFIRTIWKKTLYWQAAWF